MVKQGRAKKARSGRSKTKLKTSADAFYKKPQFTDKVVEKSWDPKISVAKNLGNIGLVGLPNADVIGGGNRANDLDNTKTGSKGNAVELFDVPTSGIIKGRTKADIMLPMSVNDQKWIFALLEKHNLDFRAMSFDIKYLNKEQKTKKQIEKQARKFLQLEEGERVVDIDEDLINKLREELEEEE